MGICASSPSSDIVPRNIFDLTSKTSFVISENENGIKLREGVLFDQDEPLRDAQIVSLALNEAARKLTKGIFYWMPSREDRARVGLSMSGPDLLYLQSNWGEKVQEQWDGMTPYERLLLTNATKKKSKSASCLGIYLLRNSITADGNEQAFPIQGRDHSEAGRWEFGCAAALLSWTDFPSVAFVKQFEIDITVEEPVLNLWHTIWFREHTCAEVVMRFWEMWHGRTKRALRSRSRDPKERRHLLVSAEECLTDMLVGTEKTDALMTMRKRKKWVVADKYERCDPGMIWLKFADLDGQHF